MRGAAEYRMLRGSNNRNATSRSVAHRSERAVAVIQQRRQLDPLHKAPGSP